MAKSSRTSMVVLVFVIAGMLLAYAFFRARDTSQQANVPSTYQQADAGTAAVQMTEDERKAYVTASIRVAELEIAPNLKPGMDEPVPGLLEVRGKVTNIGDRDIDRVFLHVFPKDENDAVIGTHIENVAKTGGFLAAGETRDFKFTIPEKKEFAGTFDHMLK